VTPPPAARRFPEHCAAVLHIPGDSAGTDHGALTARQRGPHIFWQVQLDDPSTIQQKGDSMFSNPEDETQAFHERFLRCRGLLYFVASRVLDGGEGVDEAVENCFFTAVCNPQASESEGGFRSWLLRILIDEALQILRQKRGASTTSPESVFSEQR